MPVGLQIPYYANLQDYAIFFEFDDQKPLGDQIGEPPLDEMPITELEDFLPCLNLGLARRGRHIVGMANRTGSDMIKWTAITHLLLKIPREPPKEQSGTPMPVPIGTGTGPKDAVLDGNRVPRVTPILFLPPHGLSFKIICPPRQTNRLRTILAFASCSISDGRLHAERSTSVKSA